MKEGNRMRINEIFYSLQGEGHHTGRAAVFIRFSGCNLRCSFCDTDFSDYREMTPEEILREISLYKTRFVVLTGGEPTLQVTEDFVERLHNQGYVVAIETNGTLPVPKNMDWVTVSPKRKASLPTKGGDGSHNEAIWQANEIKVIFDGVNNPEDFLPAGLKVGGRFPLDKDGNHREVLFYLQPCDVGDPEKNQVIVSACVEYIMQHPQWRLSLQTHKLIGFK